MYATNGVFQSLQGKKIERACACMKKNTRLVVGDWVVEYEAPVTRLLRFFLLLFLAVVFLRFIMLYLLNKRFFFFSCGMQSRGVLLNILIKE